jgi:hypothetical protein
MTSRKHMGKMPGHRIGSQHFPGLQWAIMYENSLQPPRPVIQKVFFDFEKNQKLEQVEYLT